MDIRMTKASDLDRLMPIFDEARATIAALGIDQWQNGYPSRTVIEEDMAHDRSFCVTDGERIVATFAVLVDGEPTYDRIYEGAWLTGESRDYLAIHRVAIAVAMRGQGIAPTIVAHVADRARAMGRRSLRVDTHRGNVVMRRMLEKNGFAYCGIIYLNNGDERVAYEKIVNT